jgi:hypothetical protein
MKKIFLLIYIGIGLLPLNCDKIKNEPMPPEPPRTVTAPKPLTEPKPSGEAKVITEPEAVKIAANAAGGFLGTWVEPQLKKNHWHIRAFSKSVTPPKYYVVDAQTGEILLKLDNTDDPAQHKALMDFISKE